MSIPTDPSASSSPPASPADTITAATLQEAQKLAGVSFTAKERELVAADVGDSVAEYHRRRAVPLSNDVAPATVFAPVLTPRKEMTRGGASGAAAVSIVVRSTLDPGPLPSSDVDIAFAPVTSLSRWIERRQLSSERLTKLYLDRLERHAPALECVVTVTRELALRQARQADEEIAGGRYRGPLHGIPWGAKDLLDTAGIKTTWGATPFKDRVPSTDATVVTKLAEAGAVLVAKTTLGALAYGDIWFDGKTRSPWKLERGSSGSSAGSAAATAAGLVGFSLGTETYGSIVSPSMRCGVTGLRPTFGRVSRAGAMALCWSLDKVGPICRSVEDTALVLAAIQGADPADPASTDHSFHFDAESLVAEGKTKKIRVGYSPSWFESSPSGNIGLDRRGLELLRELEVELVELDFPDWPYSTLQTILMTEAAAAFEELTLSDRDDELVWQDPEAWPNSFRKAWFVPAIEFVQAQRFRRKVCAMMADRFGRVDAIVGPSYAGDMLLITNNTGHPSITFPVGFRPDGQPHGMTIWGRLFDEGTILRLGFALERKLGVSNQRPPLFDQ